MEPESPYAVMVYFYGGAYLSGSNIMYPGHFLAARGVVVVIINYRLSIFGKPYIHRDDCPERPVGRARHSRKEYLDRGLSLTVFLKRANSLTSTV